MDKIIKKVLESLENSGYEAYIVGGYVRDLLVGKTSYDIDICTNALPKDLISIFPSASAKNLGGIEFKIKEYHFEIMTYREEIKYKNRKPVKFNYINNLVDDLKRRDFTINAICMNKRGEIIDLLNAKVDIASSKIKMIGDADKKLAEDPLRILRAIRIATVLDFKLDSNLYKALKKHYRKVLTLSNTRIKEELDKILLSKNVKNGLYLLGEFGILDLLKINYEDIEYVSNIEAMYAQIRVEYNLPFTKVERENITKLRKIINKGEINKLTVYYNGLYLAIVAGEVLNIDKKKINKIYKELPIHELKDINISSKDIIKIIGENNSHKIGSILKRLEKLILEGKLKNKKDSLIKYIKELDKSEESL